MSWLYAISTDRVHGLTAVRSIATSALFDSSTWALWQLATNAEALAPQWLRTSLHNRAAAIATCYEVGCNCNAECVQPNPYVKSSARSGPG